MTGSAPGGLLLEGRYRLEAAPLGRGGMGEVYQGLDQRLMREVAVKFIRLPRDADEEERQEMVRRFVRESRITAELQHPGVPAVFDAGTADDGRPYLVMQRVHGISVSDLVAEQERLSVGWAADIAAQVCSVLAAAHGASLVHRDLKPSNLMLERSGTVKVLDFGLAVALGRPDISQVTRTGHTPGTPEYMAPEQLMAGLSTARSDLYSLGCVLHEMLTGRRLFSASTPFAVASRHAAEEPVRVREIRPEVPGELSELVGALLEKRPEDRPGSAVEVYGHLIGFAEELEPIPGVLAPPSAPDPHRMYGIALSRVFVCTARENREVREVSVTEPSEPSAAVPTPAPSVGSEDIERARSEVARLVADARYRQAAETLRGAVEDASKVYGSTSPEVVELRLEWANILFEGGDFRQAGPLYAQLAEELGQGPGDDVSLVFRCRLQDATCRALGGDADEALGLLRGLLDDEVAVFGPEDPRTLELRRQIGLLELGTGRREAAETTLAKLREDLVRLHGDRHPAVVQIDDLLKDN